ncbi:hypothetical protein K492DRAFT_207799 [Lichtheimia hyalospora FSU 10163]|nr:hypothetical protein K492DRAFT_207799 [Lichtheimia hyalospora FSU 10163]
MWAAIASTLFPSLIPGKQPLCIVDKTCQRGHVDMARAFIHTNPHIPDGYLYLARHYGQQEQFNDALEIYQQALVQVPNDNVYYRLIRSGFQATTRLQQRSSNNNTDHSNNQRIPYDITMMIFGYLDLRDLFTCMGVCRQWCYNILDWPVLWEIFAARYPETYIPRVYDASTDTHFNELRLNVSSVDICTDMYTWINLLYYMKSSAVQSLYLDFKDQSFLDDSQLETLLLSLAAAIQCISPHLKRITIYDPPASKSDLLTTILESCIDLEHVVIQVNPAWRGRTTRRAPTPNNTCISSRQPLQLAVPFALKRLELSMDYPWRNKQDHHLLMDIIRRCPQLSYLTLDADDYINHGAIIRQATISCPMLKTCIVKHNDSRSSRRSQQHQQQQHIHSTPRNQTGLETLVVTGWHVQGNPDDLYSIFSKHHKTIKHLRLDCDTRLVNARLLAQVGKLGLPNLEELHLATAGETEQASMTVKDSIEALLSSCPQLATLEVNGPIVEDTHQQNTTAISKHPYPAMHHLILRTPLIQSFLLQSNCASVRIPAFQRLELVGIDITDNVMSIVKDMVSVKYAQLMGCKVNAKTESDNEKVFLASHREDKQHYHIKN